MDDVLEKLAAAGKLTPEQVSRIRENVAEFMKVAKSDPDFRREALTKLGFEWASPTGKLVRDIGVTAGAGIAMSAILGAANVGIKAGRDFIEKYRTNKEHREAFDTMMHNEPELKRHPPEQVKAVFGTLQKFSPEYAKDPLVAGTFVRTALRMESMDLPTINSLVQARKHWAEGKKRDDIDVTRHVQLAQGLVSGALDSPEFQKRIEHTISRPGALPEETVTMRESKVIRK